MNAATTSKYSSDSDSESEANINRKRFKNMQRRETRPQQYRVEWENLYKAWLKPVKDNPLRARCITCNTDFQADITVIKNHGKGVKHMKLVKGLASNQPKIDSSFFKKNEAQDQVSQAEIKVAAFISEHNLSMKLSDHLVPLMKNMFPDSRIAKDMQMGRTKCTGIIKNVLGKCCFEELVEELRYKRFSFLIDESTDISSVKNMCVCVRYFSSKCQKVVTRFFSLVQCFSGKNADEANTGATAEVIYNKLIAVFTSSGLPLENIIGFGSDGCNTMFGSKNSVVTRLELNFPGIVIQKCICHSLHLCASEACKVLPRHCEDLARNIFSFFKHSSKRQAQLLEFQEFCQVEPHKILRPSQTRWFSLLMVVNRIIEQWIIHYSYILPSSGLDIDY
ncbi:E3 SUMO-protein ligase KIAA1586-like [Anthonomus grandis grandis]|uniref:E3 SUMO-protein ligase KIAA1586-like n=1 Tax=Anthonomus grandis grandis TaxID=2921223 RepID=UPI00216512EC|nr:E3 SUMO-protein ligase KIAA1586-like [Anthonomus grandis grandis]